MNVAYKTIKSTLFILVWIESIPFYIIKKNKYIATK